MSVKATILAFFVISGFAFAQDWHWERNTELLNPSRLYPTGMNTIQFGDFDSDGDQDLAMGCKGGELQYYENIGTLDSAIWQQDSAFFASLNIGDEFAPQPALVDLNNDGTLELFITLIDLWEGFPQDSLRLFENAGTPEQPIWEEGDFGLGYDYAPVGSPQFIDYDVDGDLDLILSSYDLGPHYFENIGDEFNPDFSLNEAIFETYELPDGDYENSRLADIQGDDRFELISCAQYEVFDMAEITYSLNEGTVENPLWGEAITLWSTFSHARTEFVDIDDDQDPDLFATNYQLPIFYIENRGTPDDFEFSGGYRGLPLGPLYQDRCEDVCFVDFDGDLDFDFAHFYRAREDDAYNPGSSANHGTPAVPYFDFQENFFLGFAPHLSNVRMSPGDLNGDGLPELALSLPQAVYLHNQNGAGYYLGDSTAFQHGNPDYNRNPELADLDGDGLTDLLIRNWNNLTWKCYRNTGTPQQPQWTEYPEWIAGIDSGMGIFRVANLNRDGRPDLVGYSNEYFGFIHTGSDGNVTFEYVPEIFADLDFQFGGYYDCADIDGDGDDDILIDSANVIVLYENQIPATIEESGPQLPERVIIAINFPNPFNAGTTIRFELDSPAHVQLTVYDILGRQVARPLDGFLNAGSQELYWDGSDYRGHSLPSGIYFYNLQIGDTRTIGKMLDLK